MKINNLKTKKFEHDDPLELRGIEINDGNFDLMVNNIIEEYLLLGYDDKMILWLFKNPFYKFTYNTYKSKGEEYIKQCIEKIKAKWIGGIK